MAQRMFFTHIPRDAAAIEVIEEIIDTSGVNGNIDHVLQVWSADGKRLGTAYVVDEFMVDYVHEAVEAGGISRMQPEFVGNAPIGA